MTATEQLRSAVPQGLAAAHRLVMPWIRRLGVLLSARRASLVVAAGLAVLVGWQLGALIWLATGIPGAATAPATSDVSLAEPFQQSGVRSGEEAPVAKGLFGERSGNKGTALQRIPEEVPDTRLDLTLRGVLALENGEGFAFIASPGGEEDVYRPGDELPGDARLRFVYPDRVLLSRPGGLESLWLERSDADASGSRNIRDSDTADEAFDSSRAGQIASRLRNRLLQEPAELMNMVRFEPHESDGELQGFRMQPRGSENRELLHDLGLTSDDVITAINGIPLDDSSRITEAIKALRTADQLQVRFRRAGESRTLTIPISGTG